MAIEYSFSYMKS